MKTDNLASTIVTELLARGIIQSHEAGSALVAVKQAIEIEKRRVDKTTFLEQSNASHP